jgi:hypothetical protein
MYYIKNIKIFNVIIYLMLYYVKNYSIGKIYLLTISTQRRNFLKN